MMKFLELSTNAYTAPDADFGPLPAKHRRRRGWKFHAIAHGLMALACLAILGLAAPRVESIFRDFGLGLSWLSLAVFALSRAVSRFFVLAIIMFIGFIGLHVIALRELDSGKFNIGAARAYNRIVTLGLTGVMLALMAGVLIPLVSLVSKLSG